MAPAVRGILPGRSLTGDLIASALLSISMAALWTIGMWLFNQDESPPIFAGAFFGLVMGAFEWFKPINRAHRRRYQRRTSID